MKPIKNPIKYLGNELEYLSRVLEGESWSATAGSWTTSLEQNFAARFGRRYAVAFNSGTSTLHAALEAAGVGPGDEVLSPALTVIMNSTATFHANAVPVYVDVEPHTFNMDPRDLERKITPKAKAILTVALYGLPPNLPKIMRIAQRHGLVVIEDNAQCLLSTVHGQMAGTFGALASYSLENTKHLSCGEGGILITDDEALAQQARKMGGHGFKNLRAGEGRVRLRQDVFQDPDYKRHDVLGWNYRMPEFCAAVALAQLERAEELVDLRVRTAVLLMEAMSGCRYLMPQVTPEGYTNSFYTLGVVYDGLEQVGVSWKEFRQAYIEEGGDGIYGAWAVPYLEPMIMERTFARRCPWVYNDVAYHSGLCPVAENLQPRLMQIKTNYRDITLAEQKARAMARAIKRCGA